jgi:hypothetical protein
MMDKQGRITGLRFRIEVPVVRNDINKKKFMVSVQATIEMGKYACFAGWDSAASRKSNSFPGGGGLGR